MLNSIDNVVNAISGVLYQPYVVPLILVLAGLYFTFRLKGIQFNLFGESIRVVTEKPVNLESTSSFGALMVSTASRVGTGNIMGVSTAICVGGPGAIFWMWVTAVLGGASAFVESTLAQIYKKRNPDGSSYGGARRYLRRRPDSDLCRRLQHARGLQHAGHLLLLLLLWQNHVDRRRRGARGAVRGVRPRRR